MPRADLIHEVTVVGEYSATGGENGKLRTVPYEITFAILDTEHKADGALSVFKHRIGPKAIKYRDVSFVGLLTHTIKESATQGHDLPTDVRLMNRAQLITFIAENEYAVLPEVYEDDQDLQQACLDYKDDPTAHEKNQALKQKSMLRIPGGKFRDALELRNAHLWTDPSEQAFPQAPLVAGAKRVIPNTTTEPTEIVDKPAKKSTQPTTAQVKAKQDSLQGVI